ncbi:hypothetical protein P7C70_g7605, partial [Phenoliferia sp. Uapishka_3]
MAAPPTSSPDSASLDLDAFPSTPFPPSPSFPSSSSLSPEPFQSASSDIDMEPAPRARLDSNFSGRTLFAEYEETPATRRAKDKRWSSWTMEGNPHSPYRGFGTEESPFLVNFDPDSADGNPQKWSVAKKWVCLLSVGSATLCVAFGSSIYVGGVEGIMLTFDKGQTVVLLGLTFYVMGFSFGPMVWAPASEVFGRRLVFLWTFTPFFLFQIGCGLAKNIREDAPHLPALGGYDWIFAPHKLGWSDCRHFHTGATRSRDGTICATSVPWARARPDCWWLRRRAKSNVLAVAVLDHDVNRIIGSFGSTELKNEFGLQNFQLLLLGRSRPCPRNLRAYFEITPSRHFLINASRPKPQAPVILRKRAAHLSELHNKVYRFEGDVVAHQETIGTEKLVANKLRTSMLRPFVLLFKEPIVFLFAVYASIIYGILYLMFGAFPVVYQEIRGFSQGTAGLPFIAVGIGMMLGIVGAVFDSIRYAQKLRLNGGAPLAPEERLGICCVGGILLPISLAWFAASAKADVHWIVPTLSGAPFGCGMLLVFLGGTSYLVDTYSVYAASAMAANSFMRSLFDLSHAVGAGGVKLHNVLIDASGLHDDQWPPVTHPLIHDLWQVLSTLRCSFQVSEVIFEPGLGEPYPIANKIKFESRDVEEVYFWCGPKGHVLAGPFKMDRFVNFTNCEVKIVGVDNGRVGFVPVTREGPTLAAPGEATFVLDDGDKDRSKLKAEKWRKGGTVA